ncbi:MAG: DUF6603 domain-containing protein [Janthinobacterium lividum]
MSTALGTGFYPVLHTLRSWPSELGESSFLTALGLKNYEVSTLGQGYQVQGVLKYLGGPVFEVDIFDFARLVPGKSADSFEADFTCYFSDDSFELTVPALEVTLFLKPGLLLPVRRQGTQWVDVLTPGGVPTEPAINIQAARVSYGLGSGVGLHVDPTVRLSLSPVRIKGTSIVVEVNRVTPYLLANNDPTAGVPLGFRGIAMDSAVMHFPNIFTPDAAGSTASLVGQQVRLGTGGISGQFALVADDPTQAPVLKFTVLNKLDVQVTSAGLTLNDNSFLSSHISGTIQLPNPQSATAPKLMYDLSGSLDGEDFQLVAVAQTPVPTLDFGSLGTLDFYRAEVGKQMGKWFVGGAFSYHLNQTIPFLQKALPQTVKVYNARLSEDNALTELGVSFMWANGQQAGGSINSPAGLFLPVNIDTGIASVSSIHLRKDTGNAGRAAYEVRFNLALQLAPGEPQAGASSSDQTSGVIVRAINTGLRIGADFPNEGGNVGPAEVSLEALLPTGLAASVNLGGIVGAGSLAILEDGHRYEGSLMLNIQDRVTVHALGILTDHLPDGTEATSLLALLTATFVPIQLGMGFTLNGLGGLLGINRQADIEYLRGMVRQGQLKQLLFADSVALDPSATLALIDAAFPVARGRYIIGLMAQVGWGAVTNLITLDVALLVELPKPVRVSLLGVLQVVLPNEDANVLKLRADFLGSIDFGAKKAAFDASLSDSHILKYALTGDMAFRLYQGQNPLFVVTAGGFHPAFQPPAGAALTGLRRLTLALAQGDDLRITLASYFAVTSNTVQFGSHLDLYLRLRFGLHVDGHFGFDVLFQSNPFQVLAHVEANVAIKDGDDELLGLHLSLDVTGPGPWHIWGEASFKIWFVKVSVGVNATLGNRPAGDAPVLPPNVHELLVAALTAPASWEIEAPATAVPAGVVLRAVAGTPNQLFIDPRGALVLRQRVAPLGLTLEKYGTGAAAPTGGQRFDLTALRVGETTYASTDAGVEPVSDFFAPDQFRRLTDAQKLSSPSFQLLPNGLRLQGLAGLVGAPTATRRVVEYQQLVLDGANTGAVSGGSKLKMSPGSFQQLSRNSVLGQAYQAAQPSARVPKPTDWAEDAYAVVNAADLSVYDPAGHASFGSQILAEQFRQAQVAAHPALDGELLVVPAYQLTLA